MANQKKQTIVAGLNQKLQNTKVLVLADYSGLSVAKINQLRNDIKKAGGEFGVAKNTLLFRASQGTPIKFNRGELNGPTAALWINQEDPAAIKALTEFAKKTDDLPKIKFGYWAGELMDAEKINRLASLPTKEVLLSNLIGQLKSPLYGLVCALNWNVTKLVRTVSAIRDSRIKI